MKPYRTAKLSNRFFAEHRFVAANADSGWRFRFLIAVLGMLALQGLDSVGATAELVSSEPQKSEPSERPDSELDKMRRSAAGAKLRREKLIAEFGAGHPAVQQINEIIERVEAELKRMGAAPIGVAEPAAGSPTRQNPAPGQDQRAVIEALVRQSFELETQLQAARVAKAESDLRRVKSQLQERHRSAELIIADRVMQLLKKSEAAAKVNPDADVPASLLASEGWAAWQNRDPRSALAKFKAALAKEPDLEAAQNGLGWTYVHLGDYEQAISEFKTILKVTPTHPGALNGLGQSLLALGRLDEAEQELLKATEDAISQLGEAETVRRGVTASWFGLIRTYIKKEDFESAKKWAKRYLKHKPDDKMIKPMLQQIEAAEQDEQ
jgi:tetratricopeptide (TPR) repeat protein